MQFAGHPGRCYEEAGPAVSVEAASWGSLEEVAGKEPWNGQLPQQLWAVQGQAPIKQVLAAQLYRGDKTLDRVMG